jgi:hypothetical protein
LVCFQFHTIVLIDQASRKNLPSRKGEWRVRRARSDFFVKLADNILGRFISRRILYVKEYIYFLGDQG